MHSFPCNIATHPAPSGIVQLGKKECVSDGKIFLHWQMQGKLSIEKERLFILEWRLLRIPSDNIIDASMNTPVRQEEAFVCHTGKLSTPMTLF